LRGFFFFARNRPALLDIAKHGLSMVLKADNIAARCHAAFSSVHCFILKKNKFDVFQHGLGNEEGQSTC
jgi:hypothetical protein